MQDLCRGGGSQDFADIAQRSRGGGKYLGLKLGGRGAGPPAPPPPTPTHPPRSAPASHCIQLINVATWFNHQILAEPYQRINYHCMKRYTMHTHCHLWYFIKSWTPPANPGSYQKKSHNCMQIYILDTYMTIYGSTELIWASTWTHL